MVEVPRLGRKSQRVAGRAFVCRPEGMVASPSGQECLSGVQEEVDRKEVWLVAEWMGLQPAVTDEVPGANGKTTNSTRLRTGQGQGRTEHALGTW